MSYRNACPQQKCKKNVTIYFGFRGKIAILTGLLGQSKVGGVIVKIFITRWHYIELGNNKNSVLSFLGFIPAGQYSFF